MRTFKFKWFDEVRVIATGRPGRIKEVKRSNTGAIEYIVDVYGIQNKGELYYEDELVLVSKG